MEFSGKHQSLLVFLFFAILSLAFTSQTPTSPNDDPNTASGYINLDTLLTEDMWNQMFPKLEKAHCEAPASYYKREAFIEAAEFYRKRGFLEGPEEIVRVELAAFFAQTSTVTGSSYRLVQPPPYFWGYCYNVGHQVWGRYKFCQGDACDCLEFDCKCAEGERYYARGPIMLKWNYNYAEFSQNYFGNSSALDHPDVLLDDPVVGFASAIWYWMKPDSNGKSCHDYISNHGAESGFGLTTKVLDEKQCYVDFSEYDPNPENFYKRYLGIFGVTDSRPISCRRVEPKCKKFER